MATILLMLSGDVAPNGGDAKPCGGIDSQVQLLEYTYTSICCQILNLRIVTSQMDIPLLCYLLCYGSIFLSLTRSPYTLP